MMKSRTCIRIILCSVFLLVSLSTQAQRTLSDAAACARQWVISHHSGKAEPHLTPVASASHTHLYLFDITGGGFVVVGDNENSRDILAYSPQGSLNGPIPASLRGWLDDSQWQLEQLAQQPATTSTMHSAKDALPDSVAPLLITSWNQTHYGYNSQIPLDTVSLVDSSLANIDNRPSVGCVALATAQVMRYWSFPEHGYGSHSYSHDGAYNCWRYGTQSADFSATTYDWEHMPYQLTSVSDSVEINAVATLLHHCGIAYDMQYNGDCEGSSGANTSLAPRVLNRFFHYSSDMYCSYRQNYSDDYWIYMLQRELAASRPIIYAGHSLEDTTRQTRSGGHAFVLDGYDTNGLFHVDWGWGGACNGYFAISVLWPFTSYYFSVGHLAIFNVYPEYNAMGIPVMASDLTMDQNSYQMGDTLRGVYQMTNIGDSVVTMNVGANIYGLDDGNYYGCVDGRTITLQPGDTVTCAWAYPLPLGVGRYRAVMQYNPTPFSAGEPEDITLYLDDFDHISIAPFDIVDSNNSQMSNLVIFVRFADDEEIDKNIDIIDPIFNSDEEGYFSVANYYDAATYGNIHINTLYANQIDNDGLIYSYVDPYPRGYFMPYSTDNPDGYTDEVPLIGIHARERELLARIADYVNWWGMVSQNYTLDGNGDGAIDNVSFVVKGGVGAWASILWPHMEFFPQDSMDHTIQINGKRLHCFNLEFEGSPYFRANTFCHEIGHSLGMPDHYHYEDFTNVLPVGPWDLMGSGLQVHPSALTKYQYLHIGEGPTEITEDGTYTLYSTGSSPSQNLYYIRSLVDSTQWYVLEYRNQEDPFEAELPQTGLLVCRWVDTTTVSNVYMGNSFYHYPDHVNSYWVFRPNSNHDTLQGQINNAALGILDTFSATTDPYPYLTDGTPEDFFEIYDIQPNGTTCTFSVRFRHESVDAVAKAGWRYYPNPASNGIHIVLPDVGTQTLTIHDAIGRCVARQTVTGPETYLPLQLAKGIYTLTIGDTREKLIIE